MAPCSGCLFHSIPVSIPEMGPIQINGKEATLLPYLAQYRPVHWKPILVANNTMHSGCGCAMVATRRPNVAFFMLRVGCRILIWRSRRSWEDAVVAGALLGPSIAVTPHISLRTVVFIALPVMLHSQSRVNQWCLGFYCNATKTRAGIYRGASNMIIRSLTF